MYYDKLIDLLSQIDDAQIEMEELAECGTLKERLECALHIEALKGEHLRASLEETGGL